MKRKTCFSRKEKISGGRKVITLGNKSTTAGGATQEQVISANIDIVFIVTALDNDFNLRKLERFLIPVKKSGASPVIVLNKTDLCDDVETLKLSVIKNFSKVPVIEISALEKTGLERLKDFINEGITISFLGSSGVGKSTIINALMDEERLLTGEVSGKDSLGRHTTTWRETVILPNGGILIDNPGLRILKLFAEEDDVKDTFGDIEKIISECRFANCTHNGEPGCALKKALDNGEIDIQRYENYIFMKAEASYIEGRKKERDRKKDRKKKNNDKNGFEIKNKSSKKIRYEDI
ncbi:MAG: ribosome small subunit-dependent GTPase A [Candidatus Moranbacteria bacterium]|nr:ribosome small subunit-dependent GTPase A [Candidatus Moranbacteria bacterium]